MDVFKVLGVIPKFLNFTRPRVNDDTRAMDKLSIVKARLTDRYSLALKSTWGDSGALFPMAVADIQPYQRFRTSQRDIPQEILLAERGAGKTIQLLRWALEAAQGLDPDALVEGKSFDVRIPLYLDISYRGFKSLAYLIGTALHEAGWPPSFDHEAIKGGRLCLLLDGIDELAESEQIRFRAALHDYLAYSDSTAVCIATSNEVLARDMVKQLGLHFRIVALPLPDEKDVYDFLVDTGRATAAAVIKRVAHRPALKLPLATRLLAQLVDAGYDEPRLKSILETTPEARVVTRLMDEIITVQTHEERKLLKWLATGTRATGSSVAFQLQTVEPRWLRPMDGRLAYFVTGSIVAAPVVLLMTLVWGFWSDWSRAWIPAVSVLAILLLGATLLPSVLYRTGRRFPTRATKRKVKLSEALLGLRIHFWRYVAWVLGTGFAGVIIGLILYLLTYLPPVPIWMRIVIGLAVMGTSLLLLSGVAGQLLAGLAIMWMLSLGSTRPGLDLVAGLAVGALGAAVFRFADFGEAVEVDPDVSISFKSLFGNVQTQVIFETVKWGIYATLFSAVMIRYTHDWTWAWAGVVGAFGVGTFFFGILGATYPVVVSYITLRLAKRELRLAGPSIPERMNSLLHKGLLLTSAEGAAVRFLHPKFVEQLIRLP